MKKSYLILGAGLLLSAMYISGCSGTQSEAAAADTTAVAEEKPNYGGYASQVEHGRHLVTVGGCNDCHTPKIMTPQGPIEDTSRLLSGHYGNIPVPDVDRKKMESKGYVVTADFTSWVGPWGISYAANLTPDETGTKNWTEEQFINATRNYVLHGVTGARPLLPPMAMMPVKHYTDDELKAIFAFIQSIKPIKNMVPLPTPPASAPPAAAKQ